VTHTASSPARPVEPPRLAIFKTGDSFADVIAEHGDFEDLFSARLDGFRRRGGVIEVIDVRHQPLPAIFDQDAVMVTGSHAMVSDGEAWSEALKPWLREALDRGLPMFGVCYGHQLMAEAFGGSAGYHPRGRECGTRTLTLTEAGRGDPLFGALPDTFAAQLTHAQSALSRPEAATVLAANEHDPNQALRYGPAQYSVQFHPEFTGPVTAAYLAHQREILVAQGEDIEALERSVVDTPEASSLLDAFALALFDRRA
tara:strand:+ start:752 stop:1519 length:768 start_codon:yes stop_codon:yes gene_type:complete